MNKDKPIQNLANLHKARFLRDHQIRKDMFQSIRNDLNDNILDTITQPLEEISTQNGPPKKN